MTLEIPSNSLTYGDFDKWEAVVVALLFRILLDGPISKYQPNKASKIW